MKLNIPPVVHRILPYWLLAHAIMLFLIAMLSGVVKKMQMFEVNLSDLTISNTELSDLFTKRDVAPIIASVEEAYASGSTTASEIVSAVFGDDNNITASDLGLANKYEVGLWGYCAVSANGTRDCSSAKFDWAKDAIDMTRFDELASSTNGVAELPKDLKDALKLFSKFSMYCQAAFVSAFIHMIVGLGLGLFVSFVRPLSRKIWLMASMSIVMGATASALLASIVSGVVVGGFKDAAKDYGLKAKMNVNFLGMAWFGVFFAAGACAVWFMRAPAANGGTRASVDGEKLINGAGGPVAGSTQYQPIDHNQGAMGSGAAQPNSSYEPYSHRG
ncbi:SUR7/PalI family protein [Ceratocystis platani]|uniref:SUR7/PalI family protein n=1 Tax=Ceratocystis fimbriata f. sp. platani TaxID=88771 RepID=A0A0F8DM13_CERFI|nr:SUR7/PalI family protein [Ceratocystis platani]